jgi:uncharacterized protein (DUF58 family)
MAQLREALTAEALARLRTMELRARVMVEGHFSGQHRSHFKGASVEFADHRSYSPGDELRHLDWKLFGRSDRFFVKQYDAETNMNVLLAVDVSGSMGYRSGAVSKLQFGSYLAAGLAYLTVSQGDATGLVVFDAAVRESLPCLSRPAHLRRVWDVLDTASPGGETGLSGALAQTATSLSRRGIVVLVSDLLDEPERVLRSLAYFRHRGHDVIVFHVLDPAEVAFHFRGPTIFQDLETSERLRTESQDIRASYLRELQAFTGQLRDGCRRASVDYQQLTTDEPFDRALRAYLARRARLTR